MQDTHKRIKGINISRILLNAWQKTADFLQNRKELFAVSLRFGILNFIIFCCIGIYFRSQAYISTASLKGELYTIILFLGLPGCFALAISLICALFAMINKIMMRTIGIILSILCITFLLIDAVVFTQYKFHIESTMLALFFSEAGTELISFSWSMFFMAAAGLLIIIAAVCAMMYLAEKFSKAVFTKMSAVCAAIIIVGTLIFHIWHAVVTFHGETAMLERNQIFPCNIGLTAKRLLRRMGLKPAEKINMNINTGSFYYPKNPLTFKDNASKYNIIFLIVDSLRGDMINPKVMPFTSKIAENGAYFKNHYSNGNCTRIGVFSLFSGLIGTYWQHALAAEKGSVLIDSLIENGYQNGVFFSATLTNPEFDRTVFSRVKGMTLTRKGLTKLARDEEALTEFKSFIKKCDKSKPILSVLMFDALHGYEYPPQMKLRYNNAYKNMNYLTLRKNDDAQQLRVYNLICNASYFSDTQLENAINFLKKELDWQKTIVVITSDHGNECNETRNNVWGHNSKFSQYQLHVPLILLGGPIEKGIYEHRTYHVDVVPALLELLGCKNPISDYSSGQSLFNKKERDMMIMSSYSNRAILYGNNIYEITKKGVIYNYDLQEKNIKNPPNGKLLKKYMQEITRFSR